MMDYAAQIAELEKQIHARMNALAGADALCNRIMGRIELLRELDAEPVEVEDESAI